MFFFTCLCGYKAFDLKEIVLVLLHFPLYWEKWIQSHVKVFPIFWNVEIIISRSYSSFG